VRAARRSFTLPGCRFSKSSERAGGLDLVEDDDRAGAPEELLSNLLPQAREALRARAHAARLPQVQLEVSAVARGPAGAPSAGGRGGGRGAVWAQRAVQAQRDVWA
jgi:hypothetical protein